MKKRLTRAQKLSLIADPGRLRELLPGLETEQFAYVPGVTLESLRGE